MKTKFKEIVKKIKNWLSSLSKWAKKHIKKIISVFSLLVLILSMNLSTCQKNKTTAKADTLTSDSALIVLPDIPLQFGEYDNSMFPTSYLGYDTFLGGWVYYFVGSSNGTTGYINSIQIDGDTYCFPHFLYYGQSGNISFVNANESYLYSSGAKLTLTSLSYQTVLTNATHIGVQYFNNSSNRYGTLVYYIYDSSNNVLLSLVIEGLLPISGVSNTIPRYFSFVTISSSATSSELLEIGFNNGYFRGYEYGYSLGYQDGTTTAGVDTTPFGVLVSSVNALLQINIFGNISIANLLSMAFGIILLGFVIKIFLGG